MDFTDRLRLAAAVLGGADPRLDAVSVEPRRADSTENPFTGSGGPLDVSNARRFRARNPLDAGTLEAAYLFDGYVRRIIDSIPSHGTRRGWCADVDGEQDVFADEDEALDVWTTFREAWTMARLYGGALVLLVTDDLDTPLTEPLRLDAGVGVVALQVLDGREFSAGDWQVDAARRGWRQPETWRLHPRITGGASDVPDLIHASRCLYFPGMAVPPSMRGVFNGRDLPVLEAYLDAVLDKGTIDRTVPVMARKASTTVLTVKSFLQQVASFGKSYTTDRIRAFNQQRSSGGVAVLPEGDALAEVGASFTGFADLDANARRAMAAVEGIPQSILFGDPPAGLTTDNLSSRLQFDRLVAAQQQDVVLPNARKLYRVLASARGLDVSSVRVRFLPLDEPTQAETAALRKTYAETDALRIQAQVIDPSEARTRWRPDGSFADEVTIDTSLAGMVDGLDAEDDPMTDMLVEGEMADDGPEDSPAGDDGGP